MKKRSLAVLFFALYILGASRELKADDITLAWEHTAQHTRSDGLYSEYLLYNRLGLGLGFHYSYPYLFSGTAGVSLYMQYVYPFVQWTAYRTRYDDGAYYLHVLYAGVGARGYIAENVYIFITAGVNLHVYEQFTLGDVSFKDTFPDQDYRTILGFSFGVGYRFRMLSGDDT